MHSNCVVSLKHKCLCAYKGLGYVVMQCVFLHRNLCENCSYMCMYVYFVCYMCMYVHFVCYMCMLHVYDRQLFVNHIT